MLKSLAILRPQPLSNRLWQGVGLVAVVVLTLVVGNMFLPRERAVGGEMLGHDFLAFYTAGTLAREGEFSKLYDLGHSQAFQKETGNWFDLELGAGFGPYWNPPVYSWVFAPLTNMPYPYALASWVAINLLCAVAACVLLCRMIAPAAHPWPVYETQSLRGFVQPWRFWLLLPVLVLFSMPFIQALSHGQNTMMSLLLLTATVACWRQSRPFVAGICCGLLFYKPQLAAIVALMLVLTSGWRALAGLGLVGILLLGAQEFSMPGSTQMYLQQLPLNLRTMQIDAPYLWERHVTLKAFWRLLFQGRTPGEMSLATLMAWVASTALLTIGLFAAVRNTWKTSVDDAFGGHTRSIQRDRMIAATIASMPLLMPFYFDYDLLLLVIPFTLFAAERMRRTDESLHYHDRMIVTIGAGMYLWLMINPGLAKDSGVNLTVLLVASIAGLLIARACRESSSVAVETQPLPLPMSMATSRRIAA